MALSDGTPALRGPDVGHGRGELLIGEPDRDAARYRACRIVRIVSPIEVAHAALL